jgi:hypothetical protein
MFESILSIIVIMLALQSPLDGPPSHGSSEPSLDLLERRNKFVKSNEEFGTVGRLDLVWLLPATYWHGSQVGGRVRGCSADGKKK